MRDKQSVTEYSGVIQRVNLQNRRFSIALEDGRVLTAFTDKLRHLHPTLNGHGGCVAADGDRVRVSVVGRQDHQHIQVRGRNDAPFEVDSKEAKTRAAETNRNLGASTQGRKQTMKAGREMNRNELIAAIIGNYSGSEDEREFVAERVRNMKNDDLVLMWDAKVRQFEAQQREDRRIEEDAVRAADDAIRQLKAKEAAQEKFQAEYAAGWKDFVQAAAEFRLWSVNQANYDVLARYLDGFEKWAAKDAVLQGKVAVSRPTAAEAAEWDERASEERLDFLQNHATRSELRAAAAQESIDNRRTAQQQAIEYQIVLEHERDKRNNPYLQPLPPEITAQAIKDSSATQMRAWLKRFGNAALSARLNGIRRASATLDRGTGRGPETVSYNFE
jgi:hypothetical protein